MSTAAQRIVLASANAGKLRELGEMLAPLGIEVVAQGELGVSDADETGSSFEANAIIKAEHAVAATGLPAIADDSGLAVDALDGAPGIFSARYAGRHGDDAANNAKLLAELAGVADRGAAFHCVAVYAEPGAVPLVARGEWRGEILEAARGDGGFGYDPLFFVPEAGCSSAELDAAEKNVRSHRGQAMRELLGLLAQRFR